MARRDDDEDRDQNYDPKGEHGGDTGKTAPITGGEKGDQRRETPVHSGPTRPGSQGKQHEHSKRSGSDSGGS
jgi:hypothetical protein